MTFFKVNDPKNRELIKQVIAKRALIREADRRRKMGDALEFEELSRFFKPITQQTERLEKGIGEIPGKIANILPRPVNIQQPQPLQIQPRRQQSPPRLIASVPPQPRKKGKKAKKRSRAFTVLEDEDEEDEEDSEDEKLDEAVGGGEYELPREVKKVNGYYMLGSEAFKINEQTKKISFKNYDVEDSGKIYDFLTNEESTVKWKDLKEKEKDEFGELIFVSFNFAKTEYRNLGEIKTGNRWNNIYSHIWFNRFYFMNDEELKQEKTQHDMKTLLKTLNKPKPTIEEQRKLDKLFPETKQIIRRETQTGSGLKKNYVTLPSNPVELIERLELLTGSKDTGNTGVYNEIVSICDELLKKKIIGKGQYRQFLSNI